MFAFRAEHRRALFSDAIITDLFPTGAHPRAPIGFAKLGALCGLLGITTAQRRRREAII